MKTLMTTTFVLMLACIFAIGAFAQDDTTGQQTKKQEQTQAVQQNNAQGNTYNNGVGDDVGEPPHGPMSESGAGGPGAGTGTGSGSDSADKAFIDDDADGIADEMQRSYGDKRSVDAKADQTGASEDVNERRQLGADGDGMPHSDAEEGFGTPIDIEEINGPSEDSDAEPVRQRNKK